MSQLNNRIGLSILEDRIQLVETVKSENDYYLENVDEEFFDEIISTDSKEAKYIHILQNAFNEILLRKTLNGNLLSVTLPPTYFNVFEIPTDKNLTKTDLNEYINWEITKLFPTKNVDYFSIQKIVLNPLHFESIRKVLIFALPVHILKYIHKFSSRNSLQLKCVDNAHTALFGLLKDEKIDFPVLSIFTESNQISYFLFSRDGILSHFTKNYKSINEIPEISKDVIDKLRECNMKEVKTLNLCGNNITSELATNLKNSMDKPTDLLNPFARLKINDSLESSKFIAESYFKFAPAIGIALRK